MVELGSTEIAKAELCRAENRQHYRILHVVNALQPDKAILKVLPNPRSADAAGQFHPEDGEDLSPILSLPGRRTTGIPNTHAPRPTQSERRVPLGVSRECAQFRDDCPTSAPFTHMEHGRA